MLALRRDNKTLAVRKIAKPAADREVLIRVLLSGICNTDLEIARGYAGFKGTIGHEFVGVVEESLNQKLIGRRVVGEINAGCGKCALCLAGDPRHCPNRTVLGIVGRDGAHAEYLKLPIENLLPVPNEITDEHAVFTEPLAAACGILERAKFKKTDRVAVIGDGKLGLLCAQVVSFTGAPVVLVGKHEPKLRIATRRGIETTTPTKAAKRRRTFDVVVEASGAAPGFELALNLLKPKGTLILKSTFNAPTNMNTSSIVVDEISIVGSRCGRFKPALELLSRGAVDVESLISEEYPLSEGVHAIERAGARGVLKVLLRPS
jgi:2-desacetyl-2-hydroxyethyl bacteriochlorophyllide A dehydrogenase